MSTRGTTTSFDNVAQLRERKRVHDAVWLASVAACVLAAVVATRMRWIEAQPRPILWWFLAYVVVYAVVSDALAKIQDYRRLGLAIRVMHLTGVGLLAVLWFHMGGTRAPELLLMFALPVVSAGVLMLPQQTYLAAAFATMLVGAVCFATSPELQWYWGPEWLVRDLDYRGSRAGPEQLVATVTAFGALQAILAFLSASVSRVSIELYGRLAASLRALESVRGLFQRVFRGTPIPGMLIHAGSGRIVQASDSLNVDSSKEPLAGRSFFDVVSFERPAEIREAIRAGRSSEAFGVFHLGDDRRMGKVTTFPIQYEDENYAYLSLRDENDVYLRMAMEALDCALILVDSKGRLAYFNPGAQDWLGELRTGIPVQPIFTHLGLPRVYLELLEEGRSVTRAYIAGRTVIVSSSVFVRPEVGRVAVVVVRDAPEGSENEPSDPIRTFYAPRYFTERASRFLAQPSSEGSLALMKLEVTEDESARRAQAHFVSNIERLLREEDLFLGLRPGEFALLAPGQAPRVTAQVLQQARSSARSTNGETRLDICSSVISVSAADDLDTLMQRASRALGLNGGA